MERRIPPNLNCVDCDLSVLSATLRKSRRSSDLVLAFLLLHNLIEGVLNRQSCPQELHPIAVHQFEQVAAGAVDARGTLQVNQDFRFGWVARAAFQLSSNSVGAAQDSAVQGRHCTPRANHLHK